MRRTNRFEIVDDNTVKMFTNKGIPYMIDSEDVAKVSKYSWCISKTGYLAANIKGKVVKQHRYILGLDNPKNVVDHINGNRFDNRKCNLRICSNADNSRNCKLSKNNLTGYTGIRKTPNGRWHARIYYDGKEYSLGTYDSFKEAVSARKNGEIFYFKEFSPCMGALSNE